MPVSIGVDVGLLSVKIAVLDGTGKLPRVVSFHHHKLTDGQTTTTMAREDFVDLLRGLVDDKKIPAGAAVAVGALPASSALAREITVPFNKPELIRKVIKGQAESVFHAVSIEDLIVDFYKLADYGEKARCLVVGVKKTILRDRIETLEGAGFDVGAVDLDAAALFNALTITQAYKEGKRILAVDLGGATMKMVAIENGLLRGIRSTRLAASGIKVGEKSGSKKGGMTLESLKKGLSESEIREDVFFAEQDEGRLPVVILDEEQSELFDFSEAPEHERQNVLEKVFLEIDRTLAATRLEGPVDVVYLTGGGALHEGLEKAFSEHFAAPCERVSFKGGIASKLSAAGAEALDSYGAVSLGLALKGLGHDPAGMDFRKEEFVFHGKFDKAKRGVACALVLAFVLFFVVAYKYQMVEMDRLLRKQQYVQEYQNQIYYQLFPDEAAKPAPADFYAALMKKQKELKDKMEGFAPPDITSSLDVLRDLAQGFDQSGKKAVVKDFVIKQGKDASVMTIEVETEQTWFDIKAAVNGQNKLKVAEFRMVPTKEAKTAVQFRIGVEDPKKAARAAPGEAN